MLSQKGYTYVSLHKSLIYTLHLASILTSVLRQSQELFSNMCLLCLCHVWLWWTHRLSPNSEPLPYGSPTWNLPSSSFLSFLPILKGLTWTPLHLRSLARIPLLWTLAILPSGSTPSRRGPQMMVWGTTQCILHAVVPSSSFLAKEWASFPNHANWILSPRNRNPEWSEKVDRSKTILTAESCWTCVLTPPLRSWELQDAVFLSVVLTHFLHFREPYSFFSLHLTRVKVAPYIQTHLTRILPLPLKKIFIYLAVMGLSCGTCDLRCIMQEFSLQHMDSSCGRRAPERVL